jgi:surfactin synthase thioesterase subunit
MSARLLLLPGLGADERLFSRLGELCVPAVPARLPLPAADEAFTAYALRVAAQLDLRPEDWIGGCSFGSLVAADIARRRPVAGLVLIGGALSSAALAPPLRSLIRLAGPLPWGRLHPLVAHPLALRLAFGKLNAGVIDLLAAMAADTPVPMLRAGARFLADYHPRIPVLCPVHAIHGCRDRLLRPPPLPDCRMVAGAGHAIALSDPQPVTAFLNEIISRRSDARRHRGE